MFLMAVGGASAADWRFVGIDLDGDRWSIDRDSLYIEQGYLRAWARVEYAVPKVEPQSGEAYTVALHNFAIGCERHAYAVTTVFLSNRDGRIVGRATTLPDQWTFEEPAPDSAGDLLIRHACSLWGGVQEQERHRLLTYLESDAWALVSKSEDGNIEVYIDQTTASRSEGMANGVVQYRFAAPLLKAGKLVRYLLVMQFVDCGEKTEATSGAVGVDPDGRMLGEFHADAEYREGWELIIPGSIGNHILDFLCGTYTPASAGTTLRRDRRAAATRKPRASRPGVFFDRAKRIQRERLG
jgi:hypothetical protein